MNTLQKILEQDLIVSKEQEKLGCLKNKYVSESRKYPDGCFVYFDNKIGRINRADFKDDHEATGIRYMLKVTTKNGDLSKRDTSFYYKFENEVTPHTVLNAMNSINPVVK